MFVHTFYTQGLAINSYLIVDLFSQKAVIIDPARDIEIYLDYLQKENLTITHILETHVHADFVSGALELKQALQGHPKIYVSGMGGNEWIPVYADKAVQEGDSVDFPGFRLAALHTPGHTYEHVTWLCFDKSRNLEVPRIAFTGDFLFVGSVGRPDLLGKAEAEKLSKHLYDSLFVRISKLPNELEIYPAHGSGSLCGKALSSKPTSTLGIERLTNPLLKQRPFEEWASQLNEGMTLPPCNFGRIKKMNLKGPMPYLQQQEPSVYIDIRPPDQFYESHVAGALNIPLGNAFCNWVSSVLYKDTALGIIGGDSEGLKKAIKNLKLIGFDQVSNNQVWDKDELSKSFILESGNVIKVKDLFSKIQSSSENFSIIDVRTSAEWDVGHIKEAQHIELSALANALQDLPKNNHMYTFCGSGYRSTVAATYLAQQGFHATNVAGGMDAWKRSGLPMHDS